MENFKIIGLLVKRWKGQLGEQDHPELNAWMKEPGNARQSRELEKVWEVAGQYKGAYEPDVHDGLDRFRRRVAEERRAVRRRRLVSWISAAAAVALLLFAWQPWSSVKAGRGDEVLFLTSKGEQKTVPLPDGSEVRLNENSRLAYRSGRDGAFGRRVRLEGEGFFRVATRETQPFVIEAGRATVSVPGTAFNVRAYSEEPTTEVTVESGLVEFALPASGKSLMLAKEEKGIFERETGKLYFEENAGLNARAWQTGILSFRNTPMREVARSLEHYFQVHLDFERAEMKSCSFTFDTLHREDLPILVETVETIFEADVRQLDGRHYLLTGGSCHPD